MQVLLQTAHTALASNKPEVAIEIFSNILTEATEEIVKPHLLIIHNGLSQAYALQKNWSKAENNLYQALDIAKDFFGETHHHTALCTQNLAKLFSDQGNHSKALEYAKQTIDIITNCENLPKPLLAETLLQMGIVYYTAKEYNIAKTIVENALEIFDKAVGRKSFKAAHCLITLGEIEETEDNIENAVNLYKDAITVCHAVLASHPETAHALTKLGVLYAKVNNKEKAIIVLSQAYAMYKGLDCTENPEAELCLQTLSYCKQAVN